MFTTITRALATLALAAAFAHALCEVEEEATVSAILGPPGAAPRLAPTAACAALQQGAFLLARGLEIEKIDPTGRSSSFIRSTSSPAPLDANSPGTTFDFPATVSYMERVALRGSILMLAGSAAFEYQPSPPTASTASSPVLVANFTADPAGAGTEPISGVFAATNAYVYVAGVGCVLRAPLPATVATSQATAAAPATFAVYAGVCGSPAPATDDGGLSTSLADNGRVPTTLGAPMPTPLSIVTTGDGALASAVFELYARAFEANGAITVNVMTTMAPPGSITAGDDFAQTGGGGFVYAAAAAPAFGDVPCTMYFEGSVPTSTQFGAVFPTVMPAACAEPTNYIAAIDASGVVGNSRSEFYAVLLDGGGTALSVLKFEDCSPEQNLPTLAPPSDSGSSSSSLSAGVVVGIVIGAVVVVALVVIIVVLLVGRGGANAAVADETDSENPEHRAATDNGNNNSGAEAMRTLPSLTVSSSEQRQQDGDANDDVKGGANKDTLPARHVSINVEHAAGPSSSRAADISAMKRSLQDSSGTVKHASPNNPDATDPSQQQISALSHGDFLRSAQEVGADKAQLLRLRTWSDAELIRHNRRCEAVKNNEYRRGKLLGRGANGSVFAAVLPDGSTVAMKEVNLGGNEAQVNQQVADVANEMALLSRLHHDNLVTYYGVVSDRELMQVRLFMELVTGGSLAGLVQDMDAPLPEQTAQKYVRQIVRGLAYIHEHGVIHRDLKCDNIMRDAATGQVKLADFGTAKSVGNAAGASKAAQTMIGTPYFMAPEILAAMTVEEAEAGYGVKADIWSLGITVAELLDRGNPPWPAFPTPAHAFLHIANPESAPVLPAHIGGHAADFIRSCTERDPRRRASALELLEHPWMATILDDDEDEHNDQAVADFAEMSRRAVAEQVQSGPVVSSVGGDEPGARESIPPGLDADV